MTAWTPEQEELLRETDGCTPKLLAELALLGPPRTADAAKRKRTSMAESDRLDETRVWGSWNDRGGWPVVDPDPIQQDINFQRALFRALTGKEVETPAPAPPAPKPILITVPPVVKREPRPPGTSRRERQILAEAAERHGLTVEDLTGLSRKQKVVVARWEVMRALRDLGRSTPRIGQILNRDHSTVIHGLRESQRRAG